MQYITIIVVFIIIITVVIIIIIIITIISKHLQIFLALLEYISTKVIWGFVCRPSLYYLTTFWVDFCQISVVACPGHTPRLFLNFWRKNAFSNLSRFFFRFH